ncbi:hypothetical protein BZA77DRAFT_102674 [Pyronema omphalodes]|nr:hypothetical protein BZA77DRAFT_102674 [Pyronema omphalodes]
MLEFACCHELIAKAKIVCLPGAFFGWPFLPLLHILQLHLVACRCVPPRFSVDHGSSRLDSRSRRLVGSVAGLRDGFTVTLDFALGFCKRIPGTYNYAGAGSITSVPGLRWRPPAAILSLGRSRAFQSLSFQSCRDTRLSA